MPLAGLDPAAFQIYWQKVVEAIEAQEGAQDQVIADLAQVVADLANTVAELQATKRDSNIATSWMVPAEVVTATDTGTDVTIAILAHTRIYEDGSQVSLPGDTFTGKAYDTDYGIYYDDPTRSDTSPTYHITTILARAQNNFSNGRHRVAVVTTPVAGDPPTSGGTAPPGAGREDFDKYSTL